MERQRDKNHSNYYHSVSSSVKIVVGLYLDIYIYKENITGEIQEPILTHILSSSLKITSLWNLVLLFILIFSLGYKIYNIKFV